MQKYGKIARSARCLADSLLHSQKTICQTQLVSSSRLLTCSSGHGSITEDATLQDSTRRIRLPYSRLSTHGIADVAKEESTRNEESQTPSGDASVRQQPEASSSSSREDNSASEGGRGGSPGASHQRFPGTPAGSFSSVGSGMPPKTGQELERMIRQLKDSRNYSEALDAFRKFTSQALAKKRATGEVPSDKLPTITAVYEYLGITLRVDPVNAWIDMEPILDDMDYLGVPMGVPVFDLVLRANARARDSAAAAQSLRILRRMKAQGLEPNVFSYSNAINAANHCDDVGSAVELLKELMESGLDIQHRGPGDERGSLLARSINEIITRASTQRRVDDMIFLLSALSTLKMIIGHGALQTLLDEAVVIGDEALLLEVIRTLDNLVSSSMKGQTSGRKPILMDEGTLLMVLEVAAPLGAVTLAEETWRQLVRALQGIERNRDQSPGHLNPVPVRLPSVSSYHALIHTYASAQDIRKAFGAVAMLEAAYPHRTHGASQVRELSPLVDAISSSIEKIDAAYYLLEDMYAQGEKVSVAMSDVVLAAAGQVGDLARALETLEAMPSIGLSQSTSSFNAMVRACIRHGQLSSLPKLRADMKAAGCRYDAETYELMVEAEAVGRNIPAMMEAFTAMEASGHKATGNLLEIMLTSAEKAGAEDDVGVLSRLVFVKNRKPSTYRAKERRWEKAGGTILLHGSPNFSPRLLGSWRVNTDDSGHE